MSTNQSPLTGECYICLESNAVYAFCDCCSEQGYICKECAQVGEEEWILCNLCEKEACPTCAIVCDVCDEKRICKSCSRSGKCCNCDLVLPQVCACCEVTESFCQTCNKTLCEACGSIDLCSECSLD